MLMKTILQDLRSQGKHVAVTATTGMDPMTLHSFTGIGDGRFSREFTVARIMQNHTAIKRWEETDVLFIDEVTQLSRRTFENLDFVSKTVRNNTLPFGGIQVIAVGDFRQLPPVANLFDDGSYAFESSLWNTVFPHSLLLSKVYRQEEQDLLDLLNEFAVGKCSNSSARFIQECARPLNAADFNLEFVPKLFSTNDHVN